MTDASDKDQSQPPPVITAEQFARVDFQVPVAELKHSDVHALADAYRHAANAAEQQEDVEAQAVFAFLNALCSIMLSPDDRGEVWGAMITMNGKRSSIPTDFLGDQNEELANVFSTATHPALRARLADLVWSNDRKKGAAAKAAVEAYCESAERLLSGEFKPLYQGEARASFDALHAVLRALQIAYLTSKKGQVTDRVKQVFADLLEAARQEEGAFVVFHRAVELGRYYELVDAATIAPVIEEVATRGIGTKYTMPVQALWETAAHLYETLSDEEGRQRCLKGALVQILAMRGQVGSAGAEAHWVFKALQALRHIKGMDDEEEKLEAELRRLQKASTKELGRFTYEVKAGEQRALVVDMFDKLDLPEALRDFALLCMSPSVEKLRADALASLKSAPLASLFGVEHMDREGKPISKSPGASLGDEPDEAWFRNQIERHESIRRVHDVAGKIDPARTLINAKFGVGERHFLPVVGISPFVPSEQAHLMALGFTRFFQGDLMSSTYLLFPQLEACLRHILKLNGFDPVKRFDTDTEEDMNLGNMLERMREGLEATFGPDLVAEIERVFHTKPGLALRHQLSHGHISSAACFHPDIVYANWLIYRLTAAFIIDDWAEQVGPAIAAAR